MDCDQDDYEKLPGYYRAWDLTQVILAGRRYRVEDVGVFSDGGGTVCHLRGNCLRGVLNAGPLRLNLVDPSRACRAAAIECQDAGKMACQKIWPALAPIRRLNPIRPCRCASI